MTGKTNHLTSLPNTERARPNLWTDWQLVKMYDVKQKNIL